MRVPVHHALVMTALHAGKAVFCEWPLGNGLKEAQEMADLAQRKAVPNMSGLQSRSDPVIRYARELIDQDYVGEVLFANLKIIADAQLERGRGQRLRALGQGISLKRGHRPGFRYRGASPSPDRRHRAFRCRTKSYQSLAWISTSGSFPNT